MSNTKKSQLETGRSSHGHAGCEPVLPPRSATLESLSRARIAVIHEWMTDYAGSERVLEQILNIFPEADLFTVVDFLPEDQRGFLNGKVPKTTFIQSLPFARKAFRNYLPLMPLAIEGFDLGNYDIIISSSHSVAKGVLTGPNQLHICYCHTPIRYAWDLQHQYLREAGMSRGTKRAITRLIMHYMRIWDARTAAGVDTFVANSSYIARRINKAYSRAATVIHPPVDTDYFIPGRKADETYYLTASRLVPYKRADTVIEAFSKLPDRRLIVIGDGPQMGRCQKLAGPNVELLGFQPRPNLLKLLQGAAAFIFAAEEDFGISVVEAQACGVPVICYGRGGATESVVEDTTGLFFETQTPEATADAVERFEKRANPFNASVIRNNAERFSIEAFRNQFLSTVCATYESGADACRYLGTSAQ